MNKCRKNNNRFFKKLKIKVKKKVQKNKLKNKENSTELQKPNIEAQVYNSNKKCD